MSNNKTGFNEVVATEGFSAIATGKPQGYEATPDSTELITEVTLTSAQILALNTTPITLVPAPGAGKVIDVMGIVAKLTYNSAAYATNTTMEFRYTNGSGAKVATDMASLLTATANKTNICHALSTEIVAVENAPIVVDVATGNPATGNSPVKIQVQYRIVSV